MVSKGAVSQKVRLGHLLRSVPGRALAALRVVARRIADTPSQRRIAYLALAGMLVLTFAVGAVIGMIVLAPLQGAIFFAGLILLNTVLVVLTATNLQLSLGHAQRAAITHPSVAEAVARLSDRAGVPCPSVWVRDDDEINAFTCGHNPRHAAVVVHSGALRVWDSDELEAVLAHEIAHIKNRDVLANTIAVSLYEGIAWSGRTCLNGIAGAVRAYDHLAKDKEGGLRLIGNLGKLLGLMVFYVFYAVLFLIIEPLALLLALATSRQQEYLADDSAAKLLGSGTALARALKAADQHKATKPRVHFETGWQHLWSTHPPMAERVKRLEAFLVEKKTEIA